MLRTDVLNLLALHHNFYSYLEIGVADPSLNFNHIICPLKTGIDPDPRVDVDLHMTSNEFFNRNSKKFDLIFIDGLHEAEQVKVDIYNSLNCLNEGGFIVMHDCNPSSEMMQLVPRVSTEWTGDVWKAFVHYRREPDLLMYTIDTDYGVGVIQRGFQDSLIVAEEELTYQNFVKNKRRWLNLVPIEAFTSLLML